MALKLKDPSGNLENDGIGNSVTSGNDVSNNNTSSTGVDYRNYSMSDDIYSVENKRKESSGALAKVIIILGIGLILASIGFFNVVQTKSFLKRAKTTTGYVTRCEKYTKRRHSSRRYGSTRTYTRYRIYVTFEVDGTDYSGLYVEDVSSPQGEGTPVTVYYDPINPNRFNNGESLSYKSFVFIVFGVIILALGLYLLVVYLRDPDEVDEKLSGIFKAGGRNFTRRFTGRYHRW